MKISRRYNSSIQYSLHTKIIFTINIVGKKNVGKSSLVIREIKDTFDNFIKSSEGFEFYSKTVTQNNENISIRIWDTIGKCEYDSMTRNFFRKASAIILVYDKVDNLEEQLTMLKKQLNEYAHESVKLCIVRTKTDLNPITEQQSNFINQISQQNFKSQIFYKGQVSAKNNENVHKYFSELIALMFQEYQQNEEFREAVTPSKDSFLLGSAHANTQSLKKRSKCC